MNDSEARRWANVVLAYAKLRNALRKTEGPGWEVVPGIIGAGSPRMYLYKSFKKVMSRVWIPADPTVIANVIANIFPKEVAMRLECYADGWIAKMYSPEGVNAYFKVKEPTAMLAVLALAEKLNPPKPVKKSTTKPKRKPATKAKAKATKRKHAKKVGANR
jgi:hypothetical protein